jgi:hypothetical protein
MLRAGEFTCPDCGCGLVMVPSENLAFTGGRCGTCFMIPGWHFNATPRCAAPLPATPRHSMLRRATQHRAPQRRASRRYATLRN